MLSWFLPLTWIIKKNSVSKRDCFYAGAISFLLSVPTHLTPSDWRFQKGEDCSPFANHRERKYAQLQGTLFGLHLVLPLRKGRPLRASWRAGSNWSHPMELEIKAAWVVFKCLNFHNCFHIMGWLDIFLEHQVWESLNESFAHEVFIWIPHIDFLNHHFMKA